MKNKYYSKCSSIYLILLLANVIFMLSGCYSESDYSGDGQLKDNGASAATDRYVLNLGTVDLNKQGSTTYRIANLPSKNFVTGIDFSVGSINQEIIENQKMNTIVSLALLDSAGEEIFNRKASLANWTWARKGNKPTEAFIYGRGSGLEETYFDPKPHAEYEMKFSVLKVDPNQPKHNAVLLLKSGGWK